MTTVSVVVSLEDLAAARDEDPRDIIETVLDQLGPEDRTQFLQGLTERVLVAREEASAMAEVRRWIGSWWLSVELINDRQFMATDDEATKLLKAEKLGNGVTGPELRQRYRH